MKKLTSDVYGINVKKADPISVEQEEILWDKSVFGNHSSESLLHTFFFYNCKYFGLRGREEHRNLQISQIHLGEKMITETILNSGVRIIKRIMEGYAIAILHQNLSNNI
ncbi:Hypothetical predicted protein [Mytilus galloprovincialis]|uniref:ZMYM2-like/QRICH1 C-terminal domain-containing protein n=1 Tax=Mytilus galloprovincialis TaxID=29158 RepID=A0A8B6ELV9_MYTGA|nr:Hypothetical predicted protein [Mytilus galloprovincialis]